jgi:hypothetical protein
MATIIGELRAMCNAGTADYTVAGSAYFSDDSLQQELDKTQRYYRYVHLNEMPKIINAVYQWFDYEIPPELGQYIEEDQAGSGWCVRDMAGGSVAASGYTVNYQARRITFTANQGGSAYYIDAQVYEINAAAAAIWRKKYSFELATGYDWSSDNHSVKRSQKADNCLKMAEFFESKARPNLTGIAQSTTFVRSDENNAPWNPGGDDDNMIVHGHISHRGDY